MLYSGEPTVLCSSDLMSISCHVGCQDHWALATLQWPTRQRRDWFLQSPTLSSLLCPLLCIFATLVVTKLIPLCWNLVQNVIIVNLNWDQIENLFIPAIQTQFYKSDFDLIYRWENRPGKRLNILLTSSSKPGKRLALGHTSVDFRLSSLSSLMACVIQEGLAPNISPSRDVQNLLQGYSLGESCSQRHGLQPCLHAVRVDSRGLFREQELKVPEGRQGSHAGQGGRLSALPAPAMTTVSRGVAFLWELWGSQG